MKLIDAARNKKFGIVRKLDNYFEEYDLNLQHYLDKEIRLLEIGVERGGSLGMWKQYFPRAHIVGLDINPDCAQYAQDGVKIYIGSQQDTSLLATISEKEGAFDIIIDDGGHTMKQQIGTFETLFPLLNDGGTYIVEDIHTSYWPAFGRGRKMVNLLKGLVDDMHNWAKKKKGRASLWNRMTARGSSNIKSIHFANGICFIKKGLVKGKNTITI